MFAFFWILLVISVRTVNVRFYALLSLATFISFPEYIYALGVLSVQKVFALVFSIEVVLWMLRHKRNFTVNRITLVLSVFFFFAICASAVSNVYDGILVRSIFVSIQYFSLYLFVVIALVSEKITMRNFHWMIIVLFGVNFVVAVIEQSMSFSMGELLLPFSNLEGGWDFVGREKVRLDNTRSQGFFIHPLALAMFAVFSVVSAYHLICKNGSRISPLWYYSFVCLSALLIYMTGSRSGLFAVVIVFIFSIITLEKLIIWFVVSGSAFFTVALLWVLGSAEIFSFIIDPLMGTGKYSELANSNAVRLGQIVEAFRAIKLSPLIGHGVDSAIHFMTYKTIDNFWLSGLVNFGVIGFALFLYVVFSLYFADGVERKEYRMFFLAFLLFSLVISLNFLMMYSCIFIGLLMADQQIVRVGRLGFRKYELSYS